MYRKGASPPPLELYGARKDILTLPKSQLWPILGDFGLRLAPLQSKWDELGPSIAHRCTVYVVLGLCAKDT